MFLHYAENPVTLATSLRFQHYLSLHETGALLPEIVPVGEIKQVLDVGCGPGAWCIELAGLYPARQIVGIDSNAGLIRIAQQDLQQADMPSAPLFEYCNALEQLPYANKRFDFIHMYHSNIRNVPQVEPVLLQELWRVLRPGGWINLVDLEIGPVSSEAANTLFSYLRSGVENGDQGQEVRPVTSAVFYPQFLAQVGYHTIHYTLYPIDLGNLKGHIGHDYVMSVLASDKHIANFLDRMGLARRKDVHALLQQMAQDAQRIDYFCAGMLISMVAVKPSSGTTPG